MREFCNETLVRVSCFPAGLEYFHKIYRIPLPSEARLSFIHYATVLNTIFAVLGPVVAVAVLNVALLRLIKNRNSQELLANCHQHKGPSAQIEQERRMTRTVMAIVTCFTVTQAPSALFALLRSYILLPPRVADIVPPITNNLVLIGKMCNVVLFCMTSSIFRRRLLLSLRLWTGGIFGKERRKTLLR
ncbi:unnamed protein product, partial [Mesorhabditis spiculigera]